jgi:hypothetical protein
MHRLLFVLAGLAALFALSSARAGVEADPNKDYAICPEAGLWFVCASVFVGPEAPKLAHEMVLEIRSRFHLPAYVLNRGEEERKKQREELDRIHKLYPEAKVPLRHTRIEEQCAVLVGGYANVDEATKALKMVKKLDPPSNEKLMPILTEVRPAEDSPDGQKGLIQYTHVNPFVKSFVVHNPTIPVEHPAAPRNDPLLKKWNSGDSYSLLQCKKPWTLMIAAYQGTSVIQARNAPPSVWDKLWGKDTISKLDASSQNAHNLAEVLHKLGFEAYTLHLSQGSIVTVGGFDRADDPKIGELREALSSRFRYGQGIQLLPEFVAIEVPRP